MNFKEMMFSYSREYKMKKRKDEVLLNMILINKIQKRKTFFLNKRKAL